jgi:transcriptional regulator with PAS, ATPase and Fis domain
VIDYPELTLDETEMLAEISGKLIADGMEREVADTDALKTILDRRGEKDALRKPHFERIITADIKPVPYIVKKILERSTVVLVFGDSGTRKSFFAHCSSSSSILF